MAPDASAQPDDPELLDKRAAEHYVAGRYDEALQLAQRCADLMRLRHGADAPEYATALYHVALLYRALGRYADAEPLYKWVLKIDEDALAPEHPDISRDLSNLALLYKNQGRYSEAEPLYQHALAITEQARPPDPRALGIQLANLAGLFKAQGRSAEAEALLERAVSTFTGNEPEFIAALNNLGEVYRARGAYAEAEPLYRRAIAGRKRLSRPDHPELALYLDNLAGLYRGQGRFAEAEPLFMRSIAITEKSLGPKHLSLGVRRANLAELYITQARYAEAEQLLTSALAIVEAAVGSDHPIFASSLDSLARMHFAQGGWSRAADCWRRSTGAIIRRVLRGAQDVGQPLTGEAVSEAHQSSWQFRQLIKASYRLAAHDQDGNQRSRRELFETAQWALGSQAAQSLAQMAARGAKGDPDLAALVRERQDLLTEWQARDRMRSAAVARAPEKRDQEAEANNVARLGAIDAKIADIDKRLKLDFPDYAVFANPSPLSVEEVQGLLAPEEAVLLVLDTAEAEPIPEETFIWLVVKDAPPRWVRSELGTSALTRFVRALRCGLDEDEWATDPQAARCGEVLGTSELPDESRPLPFDLGKAHQLYQALFGQIEDLIEGRRLIIVSSGPLTSLPFQVLVTKQPETVLPSTFEAYRNIAWLGRSHAVSVLPAVSSLRTLRVDAAKTAKAPDDYVGYGDPVLTGDESCHPTKTEDRSAKTPAANSRATIGGRGGRRIGKLDTVFAKGATIEAVLAHVRALCPLPDTADEIRRVADHFRPSARLIRLGKDATKADIEALNESGTLARYRIVHFATHGLVSGEVETMTKRQGEPALVLTPPDQPKDSDDNGLLLASDVAQLKLNADWVVLSACNTAAADELGGEALSGLARAFFYAGARTLLVSHWPVYSDAAVRLTTGVFAEIDRDPKAGHAEALQRAMIKLMDDSSRPESAHNAHPAVWAPFVVVGAGPR